MVDQATGATAYTARLGSHSLHFSVIPKGQDWDVEIEGLPEPGILHEQPWTTPEMARDAALRFVTSMLEIEVIREKSEEDLKAREHDSCADQAGGRS